MASGDQSTDDETCTDCGGSGFDGKRERRCSCQPPVQNTTVAEMPKFLGRMIQVPEKLLREAHAVMRECGWQLAPAVDDGSDGVLAMAASEIEEAFADLLKGAKP